MCVYCCLAQHPQVAAHRVGRKLHTMGLLLHQPGISPVLMKTFLMCPPHTQLGQDAMLAPGTVAITQSARTQPMNGHHGNDGKPMPRWMASG